MIEHMTIKTPWNQHKFGYKREEIFNNVTNTKESVWDRPTAVIVYYIVLKMISLKKNNNTESGTHGSILYTISFPLFLEQLKKIH